MQQISSGDLTGMVKEAADGKALLDVLSTVYGEKLLLPNNKAEADRLAAADISAVAAVTLTEEKKHADGSAETVFSYSAAKHKGTMKTKETLTAKTARSSYRSYYNAYYSAYGDHVDNEKEKSAETAKDDGFTDISDSAEVKSTGVFKTDDVGVLDFQGKIFVLTGFDGDDEQKISSTIISKGGEIRSSVVLKTNYLIVNEAYDHETTKYKKALELKEKGKEILIISSGRFNELTT